MISAIIVDDEPINLNNLQVLLRVHCPQVEILGIATSAVEAEEQIFRLKPEVVFLDIQMPEVSGFDLLKNIGNRISFELVFVTAYDEYALMAIKFSALDYLLKPINIQELQAAVSKVDQAVTEKKQNLRLQNLLSILDESAPHHQKKIALPTLKETHLVPISDILRCESSNNYTTFHLRNGNSHLISKPMHEYEEMLGPYGFIRCHQSHLVNKEHIQSIINEDSGYFVMAYGNTRIPISQQRKKMIKLLFKF